MAVAGWNTKRKEEIGIHTSRPIKVKRIDGALVGVKVVARKEHGHQQENALVLEQFNKVAKLFAYRRGCLDLHERAIRAHNRAGRQDEECRCRTEEHDDDEGLVGRAMRPGYEAESDGEKIIPNT